MDAERTTVTEGEGKAEVLNAFFASVFDTQNSCIFPDKYLFENGTSQLQ